MDDSTDLQAELDQSEPTLGVLRRLRTLGTRHPRWREGFRAREGAISIVMGWRVTAIDASGAEFGFGISAGWPEQAQQLALELATILQALQGADN